VANDISCLAAIGGEIIVSNGLGVINQPWRNENENKKMSISSAKK